MAAIVLAQVGSFLGGYLASTALAGTMATASQYIAGMAIGRAVGGTLGAVIGGAIDRAIFGPAPQSVQGPRLSDLTVQSSLDGAPLPTVWGTVRIAGNVIWSTGLEEIATTTRTGGGGSGGGGRGSVTTYSYRTDVAVALCAGPIVGIRRIWADGKLIYDVGTGASYPTLTASASQAAAIRVYPGSETQQPDPLIQAVEGAANTPAYRGTAYVVFEDFLLADFGNRLPNLSFEVVRAGAPTGLALLSTSETAPSGQLVSLRRKAGEPTKAITFGVAAGWNGTTYPHRASWWYILPSGQWVLRHTAIIHHIGSYLWNICGMTWSDDYDDDSFVLCYPASSSRAFLVTLDGQNLRFWRLHEGSLSNRNNLLTREWVIYTAMASQESIRISRRKLLAEVTPTMGNWGGLEGYGISGPLNNEEPGHWCRIVLSGEMYRSSLAIDQTYLYVQTHEFPTGKVWRIPLAQLADNPGAVWTTSTLTYDSITKGARYQSFVGQRIGGGVVHQNSGVLEETADFATWTYLGPAQDHSQDFPHTSPTKIADRLYCTNSTSAERTYSYGLLSQGTAQLSGVVADILAAAGLAATQYDVTALASDTVRGYVVSGPMTMRAALEPLQMAYHFDVVEQDGKIRAVKRGGAVAVTLQADELGASERGDSVQAQVKRVDPLYLPSEIHITYIDQAADYQPATQYARRLTAKHNRRVDISLPIVLNSQEAARLADVLLNVAWHGGLHELQTALTYSHARLVPTDVVSMPANGQQWRVRITNTDLGQPGLQMLTAVPDLPALYTSNVGAADSAGIAQMLGIAGPTRLAMLDCAILRDEDNSPGWYVAMSGYLPGWPGAALYRSSDGGATYSLATTATSNQAATIGYAINVLGNADARVWDARNTVTIRLLSGSLSSATIDDVLNGANSALLGAHGRWEIIQWRTATLNADGTYTLRDLLRGRKGTEHAVGVHAQYDTFILLTPASIQTIALSAAEINVTRHHKAVTAGKALEDATAEAHTYTGERVRCLSPVLLGGGRDASGNLTIKWVRRGRINAGWNNFSDIPLGETSESYEVEVWTSGYGTLKRTITGLTTPTAIYTSAQQIADFGSNQSTVHLRVYQISAVTGRGRALQGSI